MDPQELAIRDLLDDLSEEEEARLGKLYLSNTIEFEELEIAEEELIDRYVRKELSARNHSQFEKMLLSSPRLRERVEFARILAKRVASAPGPQTASDPLPGSKSRKKSWKRFFSWGGFWGPTNGIAPALRVAFSASLVLLLVASTALFVVWSRLVAESQRLAQEQQQRSQKEKEVADARSRSQELQAQLEQAQQQNRSQQNEVAQLQQQKQELERELAQNQSFTPASFSLFPSIGSRGPGGAGIKTLPVSRNARSVRLDLNVSAGDYNSYNASLAPANDDRVIHRETNLQPFPQRGGKYIRLQVPREKLPDGLYNINVEGVVAGGQTQSFNDYTFRVRAR